MSDMARNFLILMLSGRFGGPNMAVITPYRLDDRCDPHADTVGCVRSDCSGHDRQGCPARRRSTRAC